jgi:hypothetical protein
VVFETMRDGGDAPNAVPDPCRRDSRTWLPPWVCDGETLIWIRMKDRVILFTTNCPQLLRSQMKVKAEKVGGLRLSDPTLSASVQSSNHWSDAQNAETGNSRKHGATSAPCTA